MMTNQEEHFIDGLYRVNVDPSSFKNPFVAHMVALGATHPTQWMQWDKEEPGGSDDNPVRPSHVAKVQRQTAPWRRFMRRITTCASV